MIYRRKDRANYAILRYTNVVCELSDDSSL